VDRAARNLFDHVELERLESEYDLPLISVSQPTENTRAGRMMRRTLANMANFYTEQQSVDVREGLHCGHPITGELVIEEGRVLLGVGDQLAEGFFQLDISITR
jgi:hypothetical protein